MYTCIFVHKGFNSYLDHVFAITRKFNPTLHMILLGDTDNQPIAAKHGVEYYPLASYNQPIPYYHYSTNGEAYEKFCFERWFIINNFVKAHGISLFIHSDSDNALCMDISTIAYTNARIGIKEQPVVPNVLFISSDYLDQICKFYVNLFSLPITQFVSRIDPYSHAYSKSTIHYSDMMFLQQAIDELALDFAILPEDGESILFNANIRSYDIDISGTHLFKKGTTSHLANVHFQGDMKWKAEYYLNKLNQYSNLFEFVDKIVYINLADRTDRKERLLADLHPIVPRDKIVRFDAIRHNPTTVGFTMSHIAVLELAIKNKWRNVLILEDDAILNKPEKLSQGYTNLEKIIGGHWDAICLGLLNPKYDIDTMRITQSLSTVAYMVNSHYYEVLLNHFKAALNGLVKTNEWSTYALDQWWWQLMKRDNWFGTAPSVFIQNNTISSICGEMYRCMDHYI